MEQGLLDPLLEFLKRDIGQSQKPIEPSGPEWALKRAFRDGAAAKAIEIQKWIVGRSTTSPDEAENTEDGHG